MSLTSIQEDFTLNDNEEILDLLKKYGDGALIVTGGSFVNGLDARNLLTGIEALIGTAAHKASVISFTVDGIHPHDLGTVLDHQGVAIRTGHHCAMPVMEFFGVPGTARASMAFYNNAADIDQLIEGLRVAIKMFN